jgi:hypothetical protein
MSDEQQPHNVIAMSDTDNTKAPLLGVIYGTIGVDPVTADEWLQQHDEGVTDDGDAMFILNTYNGTFALFGADGRITIDISDLPALLAQSDGWVSDE